MDSKCSLEFRNFDKAVNSFICMEVFLGLGFTDKVFAHYISIIFIFMQNLLTEKQPFDYFYFFPKTHLLTPHPVYFVSVQGDFMYSFEQYIYSKIFYFVIKMYCSFSAVFAH